MSTRTKDVSDFTRDVIQRSHETPVLVDFWAAWCGPCRTLGPVLDRMAESAEGWELAKVDTEAFAEIAQQYQVMSIPNVKLFVNGEVVDEFVGALSEREIRAFLDRALPSPRSAVITEARARADAGDVAGAQAALEAALAAQPGDSRARLLLAELLLRTAPEAVEATLGPIGDEVPDRVEALRVIAHWVMQAGRLPDGAARETFTAAITAVRAGDWDGALENVVASLRAQRGYAGGAARELGRGIYLLLGVDHPACDRHYRSFTSALYV